MDDDLDEELYELQLSNQEWIILPDNRAKIYWDILILFLLIWTATVAPYIVCFLPMRSKKWTIIETLIDFCWFGDIVLTFFTAIKDPMTGRIEFRKRILAEKYLKSWFVLDVFTTIPWSLITEFGEDGEAA